MDLLPPLPCLPEDAFDMDASNNLEDETNSETDTDAGADPETNHNRSTTNRPKWHVGVLCPVRCPLQEPGQVHVIYFHEYIATPRSPFPTLAALIRDATAYVLHHSRILSYTNGAQTPDSIRAHLNQTLNRFIQSFCIPASHPYLSNHSSLAVSTSSPLPFYVFHPHLTESQKEELNCMFHCMKNIVKAPLAHVLYSLQQLAILPSSFPPTSPPTSPHTRSGSNKWQILMQKHAGVLIGYTVTIKSVLLPFTETAFVNKTVWISIIQRAWKRVFRERVCLLQQSVWMPASPRFLSASSHARFQFQLPTLQGMLARLHRTHSRSISCCD